MSSPWFQKNLRRSQTQKSKYLSLNYRKGLVPFLRLKMNITLSARSKVLQLSKTGMPFRIQVTGTLKSGNHVDLIPDSESTSNDVTICSAPYIIADLTTINFLSGQTVDFDYQDEEFIISKRGAE